MRVSGNRHLTYCTNIHPARGLAEVVHSVRQYGGILKRALSPSAPFGIGLRLSGSESVEASRPPGLALLRQVLNEQGLYVFTMNGFPYGPFHGQPIKDDVHRPDWSDPERVNYTMRLARILASVLPQGMEGGISTSPLSYKPWLREVGRNIWHVYVDHLVTVVEELTRIRHETGCRIHVDIEPEPDGLLETSTEVVRFYNDWLFPIGIPQLAAKSGVGTSEAETLLREHLRVCLDTCHVAVAYETAAGFIDNLARSGIRVGKVQISSAIKLQLAVGRRAVEAALRPFKEPIYLHQVVQKNRDGTLTAYRDLDDAWLHLADGNAVEWRIHFHVPIFVGSFGQLASTRDTITDTLPLLGSVQHLEIETYTWEVLPAELKQPLAASIQREFEWVLGALPTT